MGRAIDLFVTYRFLKLLTTPFNKTDAYKFGIIDDKGNRIKKEGSDQPAVVLATSAQLNSYTILHKLVFNIKKIFGKVPGLRTKVGTYAAALFLLKDTFKESVDDPDVFEKEFEDDLKRFKYIKRLLRKYYETGILKERLLLNHIIVLNNVFGPDACATLLLFKIQEEYWPVLKSFLLFLNILRDNELTHITEDENVKKILKEL